MKFENCTHEERKCEVIEEISAEKFTYELYEPNFWQRLGFEFSTDDDIVLKKAIEKVIGYRKSERLAVRPKSGMIALMCEDDDGEKFWFHHYRIALEVRGAELKGLSRRRRDERI